MSTASDEHTPRELGLRLGHRWAEMKAREDMSIAQAAADADELPGRVPGLARVAPARLASHAGFWVGFHEGVRAYLAGVEHRGDLGP